MKIILIILVLGGLGYFGWNAIQTKPDVNVPQAVVSDVNETAPVTTNPTTTPDPATPVVATNKTVDNANVKVSFKGFGPGKEHSGSFSGVNSNLSLNAQNELTGSISVNVASLTTDTDGVTKHLKTDAFFDVDKYPTATFKLSSVVNGKATGTFTIHGVTKTVTFPVTVSGDAYSAKFNLNLKDFGIDQKFANEIIELSVNVPLK